LGPVPGERQMKIDDIRANFFELQEAFAQLADQIGDQMLQCGQEIVRSLRQGKKVLVFGNGGSAADAQHFAAELVGRFLKERRGLPAIALTTDSSILTAVGNDYGFDEIFSRQVEALGCPGDVVIGISTSGNSKNVYNALRVGKARGCLAVGLLGRNGGMIADIADINLIVPAPATPVIQTAHGAIIHFLCGLIEDELFE